MPFALNSITIGEEIGVIDCVNGLIRGIEQCAGKTRRQGHETIGMKSIDVGLINAHALHLL